MVGRGFIVVFGQHTLSKIYCAVNNFYTACNLNDNVALWEDLSIIKNARQTRLGVFVVTLMMLEIKMRGKGPVRGEAKGTKS